MKKTCVVLFAVVLLFSSCSSGPFDINKEGGTVFTIETDAVDFLVKTSGHSQEPVFLKALENTRTNMKERDMGYLVTFLDQYKLLHRSNPAHVFAMGDPEHFKRKMSDEELKKKLREEYSYATERVEFILEHRLESLGIPESERNIYKDKSGHIVVEVGGSHDLRRLRDFMQATAEFGFYLTYDNKEVLPLLAKLNSELATEMHPGLDTMQVQDEKEFQIMKNPLFSRLKPDAHTEGDHYALSKGCRIGFALSNDTAAINRLLNSQTPRTVFPGDMHFLWSLKPEEDNNGTQALMALYVIRATSIFEPALSGRVITDAQAEVEPNSDRPNVEMTMNSEGADEWEKITKKNTDKAIAIVLDNRVVSAPVVMGPIPGGRSSICGNFTKEETRDIAIILRSGSLPVRAYIIAEKKVSPKK